MANGTLAASQIEMLSLSGTGIITITPPATNTNRAITLPDAAGAIVVSGTTPSLNGIAFPATQVASADANTLDDYEEGTWTPIQGSGLTVTGAFSSSGRYTKIGRLVYVSGRIAAATNIATTSGTIMMTGLPFTVVELTAVGSMTNGLLNTFGGVAVFATTAYSTTTIAATVAIDFSVTYSV